MARRLGAMATQDSKKVLYIGGHGKVGLLATPKLVKAGFEVDSLVRNPDYSQEITSLGAQPVLADVTQLSATEWAEMLTRYDDVVWGAGNGGRGGAEQTWAVDRDAAMAAIDGLEQLQQENKHLPRFIMISYMDATTNTADESEESWYAYVEAKKAVDKRLNSSSLPYVILGPSVLTDEESTGITVVTDEDKQAAKQGNGPVMESPRDLVADVVTEVVSRDALPQSPVEFVKGSHGVESI